MSFLCWLYLYLLNVDMLKDAMSSKTIVQKLLYLIRCCSVVKPLLHIIAYWVPFAKTLIFSGRKDERLFGRIRSD